MFFKKVAKSKSELRYDIINKDWVVLSEGRGKRTPSADMPCVFCNYFSEPKFLDKNFAVVPNKFPAFFPQKNTILKNENPLFQKMPSIGFHEVVVFNDHSKQLTDFSQIEWEELLGVYQQRYIELSKERIVNYVSIFHNHGKMAGASLAHPHSQIIAIPFFDKDLSISLNSSREFFKEKSQCIFCATNRAEKSVQTRIVFENSNFLAVCPFASKVNFEVVISPKNHLPYFEKITKEEKSDLAQIFGEILKRIGHGLEFPDYNFYLHTSPCDDKEYPFFHWHFTIMPRISVWAGFELGSGIEIITMPPEKAAEYLRKVKI